MLLCFSLIMIIIFVNIINNISYVDTLCGRYTPLLYDTLKKEGAKIYKNTDFD